jgi:hypothetical protein
MKMYRIDTEGVKKTKSRKARWGREPGAGSRGRTMDDEVTAHSRKPTAPKVPAGKEAGVTLPNALKFQPVASPVASDRTHPRRRLFCSEIRRNRSL